MSEIDNQSRPTKDDRDHYIEMGYTPYKYILQFFIATDKLMPNVRLTRKKHAYTYMLHLCKNDTCMVIYKLHQTLVIYKLVNFKELMNYIHAWLNLVISPSLIIHQLFFFIRIQVQLSHLKEKFPQFDMLLYT